MKSKKLLDKFLLVFVLLAIFSFLVVPVYADNDPTTTSEKEKNKKTEEAKKDTPTQLMIDFANSKGTEFGQMYAGRDFIKGLTSNPSRHFKDRGAFNEYFKITKDKNKSLFYTKFMESFTSSYQMTYMELSIQNKDDDSLYWHTLANKYAKIEGQIAAYHDFLNDYPYDAEGAFKRFLLDSDLRQRFKLYKFSSKILVNFETDFKLYFLSSYRTSFKLALDEETRSNTNYFYVDSAEKTLDFQKTYNELKESEVVSNNMPTVHVYFPERAVLGRTPMAIRYVPHKSTTYTSSDAFVPVSNVYKLELQRGINSVKFHKSPIIAFDGYAVKGAGIYKWKDNRWKYITTQSAEKSIFAPIGVGEYKETLYSVFIDDDYKMPSDIGFNWAFAEIDMAIRRGHASYSANFRPEDKITREEFADFIYRTMIYRSGASYSSIDASDINNSYYKREIMYCLSESYLNKAADGSFRPQESLTYAELSSAMNKLTNNSFDLGYYALEMKNKKYYNSDYSTGASDLVSRSEAIYALYRYLD